jgi:hypothetical protein
MAVRSTLFTVDSPGGSTPVFIDMSAAIEQKFVFAGKLETLKSLLYDSGTKEKEGK